MDDILPLLNINIPYNERISQINNIISQGNSNYYELNLSVVSTTLNYDKSNYIITPKGLKNSKRKAEDGIVLFGYERKNNKMNQYIKPNNENINTDNNNIIFSKNNINSDYDEFGKDFLLNDFIFPIEEKEDNYSLYELPNFAIYYNTHDGNYYIKDFNTGVGALMKIKKYKMEGNILINIGGNYLVIYIEKNKIIIKIFNNSILEGTNEKSKVNCDLKEFDIDENQNCFINIGRNQNCDIIIEDMMLSKIQCCIEYNANDKCYYLNDGDGKKESTNGTWVFILNPTKITNNFMFKAEHTLFVANLINK